VRVLSEGALRAGLSNRARIIFIRDFGHFVQLHWLPFLFIFLHALDLIASPHTINAVHMLTIGYVRVSTDKQAERGVSLEAQEAKIRAMATVQGSDLIDVIIDGGESAKSLNRPGLQRLMTLVNSGKVQAVIVAKLDRLTRSVKDLCGLLELFEKRKVALISVAEALDTGSAAGRLVITIMGAVSQWEREAIGERTRDAMRHKRALGQRVGNIEFGFRLSADLRHLEPDRT
jgi:DNA invertase Pin-like site-specific DNA recombinase